ncbi:MAG: COR domain-containing protein, partial [Bacteroidota bacterium]
DFKELDLTNNPLPEAILSNIGESPAKDWAFLDRYTKQLEDGIADNHEVKVLILGNGNVGKSCFVSQLVHGKYLESWESSHGIIIEENFVGNERRGTKQLINPYIYNIWDFAGQDIYHATHRLFMQANALYLILWDQKTENKPFSPPLLEAGEERRYENYSIRYWLHYAEKRGKGSPVILVQTKRDLPDHEVDTLPDIRKEYESDFLLDIRQVDSKEKDIERNGYSELLFMMNKAVKKIKENETVPLLWEEVQNLVKAKKEAGDNWLTFRDFSSLAKEYAEPIEILRWLNRSGTVFYQEEYFSDGIILDHIWAIKAIYALFDREKNYHRLIQGHEGQFSGQDLLTFWADYSSFERELFISFLLACEMCFEIDPEEGRSFTERRFIAPQLLPEGTASITEDFWDGRESLQMHYHHKHFHYGIIQSFIVRTHFLTADMGLGESRGIWKMGIRLKEGNQYAQVEWLQEKIADQDESVRRLVVRVTPNAVPLLNKIRNELTQIMEEQGEASVSVDGIHFVDLQRLETESESGERHIVSTAGKILPIERFSAFVKQSERLEFAAIEEMVDGGKGPHRERLMRRKGMLQEGFSDSVPVTKILYLSAKPDDKALLFDEYNPVHKKLKDSIRRKEVELLPPSLKTDYAELLTRLKEEKPNMIHYSGHSIKEGICLENKQSGKTQLIENDELSEIFENRSRYLRLVFLNSCFSSSQAKIISQEGIYVLGINDQVIEDELAESLASCFYLGISSQESPIDIRKAIKIGCRNFCKNHPEQESILSLWWEGEEISYKDL